MNSATSKIFLTVKTIVRLLVSQQYDALEKLSGGVRLSSDEIRQALSDYQGSLIMPPDSDFIENTDLIEIEGSIPKSWSIRYDLWTVEEGRSDLTLEATLIDSENELLEVELDNIHVL